MGVNIMDTLKGADLGDVPVIPDYIHETYAAIEETLTGVLDAGAVPISIGGDHAITLGELRAIAKNTEKFHLFILIHILISVILYLDRNTITEHLLEERWKKVLLTLQNQFRLV